MSISINKLARPYLLLAFSGFCRFGGQCVDAHSNEELREWKERFEFRQRKAQKAAKMYGKSFADVVLEKLSAAKNKESVRSHFVDLWPQSI